MAETIGEIVNRTTIFGLLAAVTAPHAFGQEPNDTAKVLIQNGGILRIQGGSVAWLSFGADDHIALLQPGGTGRLEGSYKVTGDQVCVSLNPDIPGVTSPSANSDVPPTCMVMPAGKKSGDTFKVYFGPGNNYLTLK